MGYGILCVQWNGLALEDGLNINVRDGIILYMVKYGKSVILIECFK